MLGALLWSGNPRRAAHPLYTFNSSEPELQIYRPDGKIFLSFEQVSQRLETTTRELETVSQVLLIREQELAAETSRNEHFAAKLRELGIDPDTV